MHILLLLLLYILPGTPNRLIYNHIAITMKNIQNDPNIYNIGMPIYSAFVATVGPRIEPICAPATIIPIII